MAAGIEGSMPRTKCVLLFLGDDRLLDLDWERSIDLLPIAHGDVSSMFAKFDAKLVVTEFQVIGLGCRNSNYIVSTNHGKFVLRMSPVNEMNNEEAAYHLLGKTINMPKILYNCIENSSRIFIYEYIDGISLQQHMIDHNYCAPEGIVHVAKTAALIHNATKDDAIDFAQISTPPFEVWYDYFLANPILKDRLGDELYEGLKRFVANHRDFIPEIDAYISLIHSDFRPANMLINQKHEVFYVDWEYACFAGHSLADIGQFFRYRPYFSRADMKLFEEVYNQYALMKLPDHWMELSLFRDLVNPMQMLGAKQEAPRRNKDLIMMIHRTMEALGH